MFGGGYKRISAWRGRSGALTVLLSRAVRGASDAAKRVGAADSELSEIQENCGTVRKNDTGKPELYEQPEIFRLKVTKVLSDPATSFSEISTDIHRHLKECAHPGIQAFPMGASIGREDFQKEQYVYREVFSFGGCTGIRPGHPRASWQTYGCDGLPGERRRYPDRLPEDPKLSARAGTAA